MLIWTGNPFYSRTPAARAFMEAREGGVKFIVVDPRMSPIAAIADIHLRLRPGTDGALALAMANVIISEGLHDRQFVAEWTKGFDEYRAYAAEFPLERAEQITGVPAALIREAALLYATTKPAAMMPSSTPVVHHTNGVQNQRAVAALVGLTGNWDIPGGNVVQPPSWLETGGGFVTREGEFKMTRQWSELPPRVGAARFPVWTDMIDQGQAMDLPRHIDSGEPYPLRGLVAFGLNYRMFPDSLGFLEAIQKLDFIVDVDPFATDTAKYADIVLPACTSVERSELRCYPQKYVIFTQPVIEPLGESRSDHDIIFALADRLGLPYEPGDHPRGGTYLPNGAPDFNDAFEATTDWILQPSGMTVAQLKEHPGGMPVPNPLPVSFRKYEKNGFPTPSGKMELTSSLLDKHSQHPGIDALPVYREPRLSAETTPEIAKDYPLILGTGTRLPMFIHSRTFRLPWTRSLRPDAAVDLNPADATRLGIRQGDRVELSTPNGAIEVKANVTELAHPGVAHMFHDYPEADVNTLLPGDYLDPISGFPGFKALLCAVRKVGPAPAAAGARGAQR
jgi:anaerobic selenocysteine-containing dehydrogenase